MDFLRYPYVRWAILAVLALAVLVLVKRAIAWFGGREDRNLDAQLKAALAAGDLKRAGNIQVQRGNLIEATRILERGKEYARAAEVHLQLGNDKQAAENFALAGVHDRAGPIFKQLKDLPKAAASLEQSKHQADRLEAAACYLELKEYLKAGRIFQDCEEYEKAARAFKNVEDLDSLDTALTMMENAALKASPEMRKSLWSDAAVLATKLGAHERAAKAHDEAGELRKAADIYEKALKQFDVAAVLFVEAGDDASYQRLISAGASNATVLDLRTKRARARGDTALATQLSEGVQRQQKVAVPDDGGATRVSGEGKRGGDVETRHEDRFEVLGELGRGGMGVVHKAKDQRLGRLVALKFLPPHATEDPTLLKLFRREARAAAALTHPGIVTIYDVGVMGSREFIAMELVEGETLDAVLDTAGPLPIDSLLDLFEKVCSAIEYAHNNNVIHRDIKPANLMRTKLGVKVMDFGLAKLVNVKTTGGQTVIGGTPNYMPREQLTGQADHRADIFALGATFYELATGVLPGHPGVPAHKADSYPSPRQRVPAIPAKFSELLMHCLEPNAGDRPQDLPTILRELRSIRAELATPDVVVTPRKEARPEPRPAIEPTAVSKQRSPLPRISREEDDDKPRKNIVEVVDLGKKR